MYDWLYKCPPDLPHQQAQVIVTMKEDVGTNIVLRQQPFASPEKLHDVAAETYRNIKTKLSLVQRSMALYLANKDTEAILFRPIKVCGGVYLLPNIHFQKSKLTFSSNSENWIYMYNLITKQWYREQ